jgi:hypothetical protein
MLSLKGRMRELFGFQELGASHPHTTSELHEPRMKTNTGQRTAKFMWLWEVKRGSSEPVETPPGHFVERLMFRDVLLFLSVLCFFFDSLLSQCGRPLSWGSKAPIPSRNGEDYALLGRGVQGRAKRFSEPTAAVFTPGSFLIGGVLPHWEWIQAKGWSEWFAGGFNYFNCARGLA